MPSRNENAQRGRMDKWFFIGIGLTVTKNNSRWSADFKRQIKNHLSILLSKSRLL